MPSSTDKPKENLQSFLGLVGFFKRLIKNYGDLTSPLFDLLKKGSTFSWSVEHQNCFDQLKSILTSKPVLHLPVWGRGFEIFVMRLLKD